MVKLRMFIEVLVVYLLFLVCCPLIDVALCIGFFVMEADQGILGKRYLIGSGVATLVSLLVCSFWII